MKLPRRYLLLSLTFLILAVFAFAVASQRNAPPPAHFPEPLEGDLKKLMRAALESEYALKQVAYLCNNIGPRLSGSPQAEASVAYIAAEMKRLGLEVQLEPVTVPHWVRGVETGELTEFRGQPPGTTQKIVLTANGGSVATPAAGINTEVVVVENFEQLAALGRDRVAGKIVLFNVKFDRRLAAQGRGGDAYGQAVAYRGGGASAAAKLGAVAALNRSAGGAEYRLAHTGAMNYAEGVTKIPAASVAAEDAELIASLAVQGPVKMRLVLTPQTLPDVQSHNVIADLRGSEHPEQVVIVSGHLDSWDLGTGALDDAAGVAIAMQTVNLIKQLGLKPKRTIRVIPWMNEENGLRGGATYAANHQNDVPNHIAAIEADMGAGHPLGISGNASPEAMAMLRPVSAILQNFGAGLMNTAAGPTGADIGPLGGLGVPTFAPIQDNRTYFDYHHTAADTFDKIVPGELAENAAVMAVLAYAIANLPEPLPRKQK